MDEKSILEMPLWKIITALRERELSCALSFYYATENI
jgi:hypothetical protein